MCKRNDPFPKPDENDGLNSRPLCIQKVSNREQNSLLMNIERTIVAHWARLRWLPLQQGIDNEGDKSDRECS